MATSNDTPKTFLSQGKFIHPDDRRVLELRARAMRAEAMRQAARTIGRVVRGWFTHSRAATHRPGLVRARAH